MYSTCIFCGGALRRNEVIGAFTVAGGCVRPGARPALRSLSWLPPVEPAPLEERWEALESLERITRDTRTRYSTGEISLVRHPDGLDLVRIGRPQLPEYAAWRYGTELVRRRRRHILVGGAVTVGGGHPSAKQVTAVDVPEMSFLMIDGQGDPNTSPDYGHAISLPAREAPTIELHHFIDESGRERCGKHHEIYLSDLRRADPSKWKTVGRQPMR